jgi:hypothetical protein
MNTDMRKSMICLATTFILLTTTASAQPPAPVSDMTPCEKIPTQIAVPDDFVIILRSGPVMASRGTTTTTKMNAAGQVTILSTLRSGTKKEEKESQKQVSKEAVRRIYAVVIGCRFFDLQKSYWNRRVIDGSVSGLNVTADGKSHGVNVHHYYVNRFTKIVSALNDAIIR